MLHTLLNAAKDCDHSKRSLLSKDTPSRDLFSDGAPAFDLCSLRNRIQRKDFSDYYRSLANQDSLTALVKSVILHHH